MNCSLYLSLVVVVLDEIRCSVGDRHAMPLKAILSFMKMGSQQAVLHRSCAHIICTFRPTWKKKFVSVDVHKTFVEWWVSFVKNRCSDSRTSHGDVNECLRTVHFHCPISAKFCVSDLHIMLIRIHEFRENRLREGCTFITTLVQWHLRLYLETLRHFESKDCLYGIFALRHGVRHFKAGSTQPSAERFRRLLGIKAAGAWTHHSFLARYNCRTWLR